MAEISQQAIAARAYALYVRRGRQPGHSLDDWLEAERQLKALASAASHAHPPAPQRSLVPGAPGAPKTPTPLTPSPSAPAVPAAHVEAARPAAAPPTMSKPAKGNGKKKK